MNENRKWVKESLFGTWFLNTDTWLNHVLKIALNDLEGLIGTRRDRYPLILDVGCGYGNALKLLEERFKPDTIIGLDVDKDALESAREKAKNCQCEVKLINAFSESVELPDRSVDLIFCHQTFHHLVDQESAIREFFRISKPGSILLFAESCRKYIHSLLIRLLFRHPMDAQRTAEEYLKLIRQTGFVFDRRNVSFPYLWWSRNDLGLVEWLGFPPPSEREETLVNVVAMRPNVD